MSKKRTWSKAEKRVVFGTTLLCLLFLAVPLGRPFLKSLFHIPDCIEVPTDSVFHGIAWSPDGKLIASHLLNVTPGRGWPSGDLSIWRVDQSSMVRQISLPWDISVDPRGKVRKFPYFGETVRWLADNSIITTGQIGAAAIAKPGSDKAHEFVALRPPLKVRSNNLSFNKRFDRAIDLSAGILHLQKRAGRWKVRNTRRFNVWKTGWRDNGEMLPDGKSFLVTAYTREDFEAANPRGRGGDRTPYKLLRLGWEKGEVIWKRESEKARTIALSRDGKTAYVIFVTKDPPSTGPGDIVISAWIEAIAVSNGATLWRTAELETSGYDSPHVSADGKYLAVREKYKSTIPRVQVFDCATGHRVATLVGRKLEWVQEVTPGYISSPERQQLEFSPNGKKLALAFRNRIYVWSEPAWRRS